MSVSSGSFGGFFFAGRGLVPFRWALVYSRPVCVHVRRRHVTAALAKPFLDIRKCSVSAPPKFSPQVSTTHFLSHQTQE